MRGMLFRLARRLAPALASLCIAACYSGGPPTGPDPVDNITLRPVSDVRIDKVVTPTMPVTYPEPVADGGLPPLTVSCSPASGTTFPLGTTVVTCSATDGVRTAECHFSVVLVPVVPVISATKFLAFGDSITNGQAQDNRVIKRAERKWSDP